MFASLPQAIEAVLAAKRELSGRDPGRELISLARKMLEDERGGKKKQEELARILASFETQSARSDAPGALPLLENESPSETRLIPLVPEKHDGSGVRKNFPQIRFSIVRHTPKEETGFRDIPSLPAEALTGHLLSGLGLSPHERATIAGSPAGERWSILLRLLSPETKVPM